MEYKQVYIPRTCKQKCNYMRFPYMLVGTKKKKDVACTVAQAQEVLHVCFLRNEP